MVYCGIRVVWPFHKKKQGGINEVLTFQDRL